MEQPIFDFNKKISLESLLVFLFFLPFIIFLSLSIFQALKIGVLKPIYPQLFMTAIVVFLLQGFIRNWILQYVRIYSDFLDKNGKILAFKHIHSIHFLKIKDFEESHSSSSSVPTIKKYLLFRNEKNEEIFHIEVRKFNSTKNIKKFLDFLLHKYPHIQLDETIQSMKEGTFKNPPVKIFVMITIASYMNYKFLLLLFS